MIISLLAAAKTGQVQEFPMQMKYTDKLATAKSCPPANVTATARVGFRWVHSDIDHPNNDLPVGCIIPNRYPPGHPKYCDSWALSLFATCQFAKDRYKEVAKFSERFARTVGDAVMKVNLLPEDGLQTPPDSTGHFNLFQSLEFSLKSRCMEVVSVQ